MTTLDDLVSPEVRDQYRLYYADKNISVAKTHRWGPYVGSLAHRLGAHYSILDYGCGRQALQKALPRMTITPFDPCLPAFAALPSPHTLVVCCDVLEHVEPDKLDNVIAHLLSLTKRDLFLVVACKPSGKVLPNGKNQHAIIESVDWWLAKLRAVAPFTIVNRAKTYIALNYDREAHAYTGEGPQV